MLAEMLDTPIQFRHNFWGNGDIRWMGLDFVPEFRNKLKFFRRREPLHIRKLLKNHGLSITDGTLEATKRANGRKRAYQRQKLGISMETLNSCPACRSAAKL